MSEPGPTAAPRTPASRAPVPRSAAVDAVRLLAVVAVVVGHVSAGRRAVALTYGWHVPVFFVVSGYLWRPGRPLADELRRRWRSLGRPYVFWLAVVGSTGLLLHAGRGQSRQNLLGEGRDALLGGAYAGAPLTAFWFVTALLVAVVVWRALERLPPLVRAGAAAAGLAVSTVAGEGLARVPLSAGTALGCLVLLGAGQVLRAVRPRVPVPLVTGLLLVAGGAALLLSGAVDPLFLKGGLFGTPVLSPVVAVAVGAGLLLVAEAVVPRLPDPAQGALVAVAPALVVVVLVHALVLDVLLPRATPARLPLVAAAAVAVPLALGLALGRTRVSGWSTGRD